MNEMWIVYASAAVWIGIGLYATFIACAQRSLARKLARIEELRDDQDR